MDRVTLLGRGVYDIAEAARLTGLHPNRVWAWFRPRQRMRQIPVFNSDYQQLGFRDRISFLNLIEILVVGRLREQNVSLQEIRAAYKLLQDDLSTDHPFSHRNLYTHGGKIFTKVVEESGNALLYQVVKRQGFIEEAMQPHLHAIDYSRTSLLAERWRISQGVVIDPEVHFGRPVVEGRSTMTAVLAGAYRANENDAAFVASLYEVSATDVENAVAFEKSFGVRSAA